MISFKDNIDVDQARERVFGFISDLNNLSRFQAEVVQTKVITPGPIVVGTRFDEMVKLGPWRVPTECVVTEFDPRGSMTFQATSKPVSYVGRFTVEAVGNGSRVTIQGTARLRGLWRLLEPILAGDVRKGVRHELAAIKRLTEAL